jgi:hypothetical protein
MKQKQAIDRREFTKESGLAFLGGVTILVSACGGGGGTDYGTTPATNPPAPPATNKPTDQSGQISSNHGHTAVVTSAQLTAGGAVMGLDIKGAATHSHTINLPAQAITDIKDGKPIQVMSSSGEGHDHLVTFNPESPAPPTRY